jgi:hypothetical protein
VSLVRSGKRKEGHLVADVLDPATRLIVKKLDTIAALLACQVRGELEPAEIISTLTGIGLSQPEVAALLGTTAKGIERTLYRARRRSR